MVDVELSRLRHQRNPHLRRRSRYKGIGPARLRVRLSILANKRLLIDNDRFNHINIDDCWQAARRDPQTHAPQEDKTRFPSGMAKLVKGLHELGFKAGIYSSGGVMTCQRLFGSLDLEEIDAKTYAEWGFDALKYDNCYNEGRSGTAKLSFDRYNVMRRALNATGRPILYQLCNWGEDGPWNCLSTNTVKNHRIC